MIREKNVPYGMACHMVWHFFQGIFLRRCILLLLLTKINYYYIILGKMSNCGIKVDEKWRK